MIPERQHSMSAMLDDVLGQHRRAQERMHAPPPPPREHSGRPRYPLEGASLWGMPVHLSDRLPPGAVMVAGDWGEVAITGLTTSVWAAARDRYGDPSALARLLKPVPLESRWTVGSSEARRDRRRRR